jgi:predicted ATPase
MLKRFRVSNFKSLLNVEFKPVGLNLLVGQNNAGKSNLCSALRFLGLTSSNTLENAAKATLGETWNISNVYVSEKDKTIELEVEATLSDEGQQLEFDYLLRITADRDSSSLKQSLKVSEEVLKLTAGKFQQTPLLENRNGQAKLLHEKRFLGEVSGWDKYVETLTPQDATMLSRLFDLDTNRRANLFKRYLQGWFYYNLYPHALRSPEVANERALIGHDGSNLSKVLYALHNEKPRLERKIIDMVRTLEPKLDLFTFSSPDPESVYLFLEDQSGNRFSTQSISDGTLRFLAMSYLILMQGNFGDASGPASLILIEEPENGLYVGHLKPLLEKIDPSGQFGQFIFTSHSPYFIDLWDANVDGIHLIKPGKPSSVLVRPNPDKVRQLLNDMSLGEMHYREMLG